ncbi:MAG TPA: hypothetical protein VFL86_16115 [Burkholderiaceae bacterium]|nr:hypothetical protein [Burkholderiaceae bacterium]
MSALPEASLPTSAEWGHRTPEVSPGNLIEQLVEETERAVAEYAVLPEGPVPCTNAPGHERVSIVIPVSVRLLDQLMNGRTGYRAHYAASVEVGEAFNRALVESVAPRIIAASGLYSDKFSLDLCRGSLLGPFSKFWFTKQLTDPSAQEQLLASAEAIRFPRWQEYWHSKPEPRKGLLAPKPEEAAVLLNGSFVNRAGLCYEQKPGRSAELFARGWT